MSARVFNPLVMTEMRLTMSRSGSNASGTPAAFPRVRRDLFGPVDHEEVKKFVDKELAAMQKRESEKWGFDFEHDMPLPNLKFHWERITPEDNTQAYALRGLTLQLEQRTEPSAGTSTTNSNKDSSCQDVTTTTTQIEKLSKKQSRITDFLKCRKRSMAKRVAAGNGKKTGMIKRKRNHPKARV